MIIMSFQHKSSLEQIKNSGRYFCPIDSTYSIETPKIYSYLRELIFNKTGFDCRPIFGWSNLINYKADENGNHNPIKLDPPSFDSIFSATQKVPFDGRDYYIYILDVPNELVVSHDFFHFACFKADEDEGLCTDKQLKDFIFNPSFCVHDDVQTCFPYIDKSFVKGVYEFELITDKFGLKTVDIKFNNFDWKVENNNSGVLNPSSIFK